MLSSHHRQFRRFFVLRMIFIARNEFFMVTWKRHFWCRQVYAFMWLYNIMVWLIYYSTPHMTSFILSLPSQTIWFTQFKAEDFRCLLWMFINHSHIQIPSFHASKLCLWKNIHMAKFVQKSHKRREHHPLAKCEKRQKRSR